MMLRDLSIFAVLLLTSCAEAGWSSYYEAFPKTTSNKYIAESAANVTPIKQKSGKEIDLELPRDCSGFKLVGFFTPFTPPIPLPWFRSWSTAECHYFTAQTKPQAIVQLMAGDKIYSPRVAEGLYGYTKYIFPIRAKNLDSGVIILEKDGEKIEIPFKYKYFKFWY